MACQGVRFAAMVEVSIIHIAAGVFIGNVAFAAVRWAMLKFDTDNVSEIPWSAFVAFLLVIGLTCLLLFGQKVQLGV